MSIANNPDLLIADEPTTALDVTVQLQILELIKKLQEKMNMSILFISHDLSVVKTLSDYIESQQDTEDDISASFNPNAEGSVDQINLEDLLDSMDPGEKERDESDKCFLH